MACVMMFHYRNSDNFMTRMNPMAKFLALISYSLAVTSAEGIYIYALFMLPFIVAAIIRLPFKDYAKESIFFIFLSLFIFFTSIISQKSLFLASSDALSLLSLVFSAIIFSDTTLPDEISRSLGSLLFHVIGKYAYYISSALEMTLSMIPVIADSISQILEARKARLASFVRHPLRNLVSFTIQAVSDLFDKVEIYTDALYSRGYDAGKRRSAMRYRASDIFVIVLSITCLILSFVIL